MRSASSIYTILAILIAATWIMTGTGCANIIPPGGGPRDTIPPMLVSSSPKDSATNVKTNRITLQFDEFVEVQSAMENVLVSPMPANIPVVDYKLRTVTVKLRDTLEPNTTYSINFGNAIKDINEANILKDFVYVFSTGNTIDNNMLTGKVLVAETGKIDSTLIVLLHRDLQDSAVAKERPRFIAKVDGKGMFRFTNLPTGTFALYALPNDYTKRYDDSAKLFAFADQPINIKADNAAVTLYAYNFPKAQTTATPPSAIKPPASRGVAATAADKAIRYTTNLQPGGRLDIFGNVELTFNKGINAFDSVRVLLTNKDFAVVPGYYFTADSSKHKFTVHYNWGLDQTYNLLVPAGAFKDSSGATTARNDTIKISTKRNEDYGSVKLRFNNLDLAKNPVLLLLQNDKIVEASALTARDWTRKLYAPGEYDMRILYDTNKNGKWDPGSFFGTKRQPEIVRDLKIKLDVRGNWDNEKEITL